MIVLCECDGMHCLQTIDLPLEELQKIKANSNNVIIVDDCPTGPEPTDTLMEVKSGYSIFREGQ